MTESLEYKTLEAELNSTTETLKRLREEMQNIKQEVSCKQQQCTDLKREV